MLTFPRIPSSRLAVPLLGVSLLLACGCKRGHGHGVEYVYVVPKQEYLRDRIAAISNKVAPVSNGERLQVLEHNRRFLKVRTAGGQVGWLEEHAVIEQPVYDEFARLQSQHAKDPAVANGVLRDQIYAHLTAGRDAERFLLLPENDKLELLERASLPKLTPEQLYEEQLRKQQARAAMEKAAEDARAGRATVKAQAASVNLASANGKAAETSGVGQPGRTQSGPAESRSAQPGAARGGKRSKPGAGDDKPQPMEDWWLVRDSAGRVGWVLARRIDVDVPDEVVRYAEGQKIVGAYLLAKVHDEASPFPDKEAPEYVAVLNPYKDGLPYDYSMVRVFVWNPKKHRYEGGLREKDLVGYLPVTVKQQTLDQAGPVPTFTLRLAVDGSTPGLDATTGRMLPVKTFEETYRLDGETVRRVPPADGESPTPASSASPEEQARQRERAARRAAWRAAHAHPHKEAGRRKRRG